MDTKACCLVSIPGPAHGSATPTDDIPRLPEQAAGCSNASFFNGTNATHNVSFHEKSFFTGIGVGIGAILLIEMIAYCCKTRFDAFEEQLRGIQASFKGSRKLKEQDELEMQSNPMQHRRKAPPRTKGEYSRTSE